MATNIDVDQKAQEAIDAASASYGIGTASSRAFSQPVAAKMSSAELAAYDAQNYQPGDDISTTYVTASSLKKATGTSNTSDHQYTLTETGTTNVVLFEVMPEVSENHSAEYEAVGPTQFPGAFQKYKGSSTTTWVVNATFISRTTEEATKNYKLVMMLRGWMQPFFGKKTGASFPHKLGAPPPVLTFKGLRGLVGPVPVVLSSMTWSWPKDVDYIATDIVGTDGNVKPWPVVLTIPLNLTESYSVDQFNGFSLADYRAGNMPAAFTNVDAEVVQATTTTTTDSKGNPT